MKKVFLFIFISILVFVALSWSSRKEIESNLDEKIAQIMMERQDEVMIRDTFNDLNSGNYQQGNGFLLKKYAEELGYYVVPVINKNNNALLILRYGPRKVVITNDEKVIITIKDDKWTDGLDINLRISSGKYLIMCGNKNPESKVDNEAIIQIAAVLNNLRISDTLEEMAKKNQADFEKYISTPEILKSFS